MRRLLTLGSDVNCYNSVGQTPFLLALNFKADHFSLDVVRDIILLGYNADVNFKDRSGRTPLYYVAFDDLNRWVFLELDCLAFFTFLFFLPFSPVS